MKNKDTQNEGIYPAGWEKMSLEQKLSHMKEKYERLDSWGSDTSHLVLFSTTRPEVAFLTGYSVAVSCVQYGGEDLDLLLDSPVKEDDFDKTAIPAELVEILKKDACKYPNIISGNYDGSTCHEAVDGMMLKLELLKYGYRFGNYRDYKEEHPEFFEEEE